MQKSIVEGRYIPEFLATLLICNFAIVTILPFKGITTISIPLTCLLLIIFTYRNLKKWKLKISFVVCLCTICILLFNVIIHPYPSVYTVLKQFLLFGLPYMIVPIFSLNTKIICHYIYIIGLVSLPFFITYDYGYSLLEGPNSLIEESPLMEMSYRIIPFIFASFYEFKDPKAYISKILALLVLLLYSIILLIIGSRGAILSVLFFFIVFFIVSTDNIIIRFKRLSFVIFLTIIGVLTFNNLLFSLQNLLDGIGLSFMSIERMAYKINEGTSLLSGRDSLLILAWEDIRQSPIIGNGVASFDDFSGMYPHNLIIHIFQEGGLIILMPFLYVFIKGFRHLMYGHIQDYKYRLYNILFCSCMIQLMFSKTYWEQSFFWIIVSYILNELIMIKQDRDENKNIDRMLLS